MLQKIILTAKPWQKLLISIISLICICIATLGFLLCICAFVIIRIDTPEYVLIPLTTAMLTFASFIDSFLSAKVFHENGLIIGLAIGTIFTVIVIGVGVFYQVFAFSNLFFTKIAAVMLAGIIGGILGVNS